MRGELPEGWVEAVFDDVADVAANLVEPAKYQQFPHIAPNHIESNSGKLLPYTTIEADGVKSPKHLFRPGQILYSKIRPYLAKAVLVDFKGLCSADMYPVDTEIEPRFLFRWMLGSSFTELASRSQGRTVLPKINRKALGELRVPVPPLNEQKRIVAKIDALTEKSREAREALDEVPALLDQLRQSILAAAFRGDLTKKWREQNPDVEPASVLLERIRKERRKKWEEAELAKFKAKGKVPPDDKWKDKYVEPAPVDTEGLPELPEGWCWASVEELLVDGGLAYGILKPGPSDPSGVPMVRIMDLKEDGIDSSDLFHVSPKLAEEFTRTRLSKGDVLLAVMATVGRCSVVPEELDGANVNRALAVLRLTRLLDSHLFCWILRSPHFTSTFLEHKVGSAQQRINLGDLRTFPVPLAPSAEHKVLLGAVRAGMEAVGEPARLTAACEEELNHLDSSILAKAFRGELVPQDPNDEPASVLLERIRKEREGAGPAKKSRAKTKS